MTDRLITIKAFGNKRTQYNAATGSAIMKGKQMPITPFRAAMNAGDEAGSVNSGVLSHLYAPSQANGIGNMSKHFNAGGNSTGESAYTGNQNFVYDGSDYTRFKKLQAFNRERGAATAVAPAAAAAAASSGNMECLTASSVVNVIYSGGNKYRFNGDTTYVANKYYGLGLGTYTLTGVSSGHPIAILNAGKTSSITYDGVEANKSTKTVSGTSYNFYHGDVTVTVSGDFDSVSVYCFEHGSMGGENLLRYSSACTL